MLTRKVQLLTQPDVAVKKTVSSSLEQRCNQLHPESEKSGSGGAGQRLVFDFIPIYGIITPNMGMDDSKTGEYLFNKTRRGILTLLYNRPGEAFYVNQIVDLLETGSGAVQRELGMMVEAGVATRTKQGNLVLYRANETSLIYDELKSLINKTTVSATPPPDYTAQRFKVTEEALANFCRKHHIIKLALYGEVLREDFTATSPINVLVEFQAGYAPGFGIVNIEQELGRLASRKVDLRSPGDLSRYVRGEVAREARVIYAAVRKK